jgi:Toprim domain
MRPRRQPVSGARTYRASHTQRSRGRIPDDAIADLVDRLAADAEAVCRRYLSRGRREGGYWRVGDLANTPGRSLFVRLKSTAKGQAGKWTDAESGEHGDLLDIIRARSGLRSFPEVVAEARAFLGLPADGGRSDRTARRRASRPSGRHDPAAMTRSLSEQPRAMRFTIEQPDGEPTLADMINAARQLFAASVPIAGSLAETYLRRRGISALDGLAALRFHPACLYRDDGQASASDEADASAVRSDARESCKFSPGGSCPGPSLPGSSLPVSAWRGPALIAAVTDAAGWITGVQRTWLDRKWLDADALYSNAPLDDRHGKADLPDARRSLGLLAEGVVRLPALMAGGCGDVLLAGEGVETVLSLRAALTKAPMAATLSAGQLAGLAWPPGLRRLIIARDDDPAGGAAAAALFARASQAGAEAIVLSPGRADFNDDLRCDGAAALLVRIREQLAAHGWADLCAAVP